MEGKEIKIQKIKEPNIYRVIGHKTWKDCRQAIVNQFKVYNQHCILIKAYYGRKTFYHDVKILFMEK